MARVDQAPRDATTLPRTCGVQTRDKLVQLFTETGSCTAMA